jgi:hypothetical protein
MRRAIAGLDRLRREHRGAQRSQSKAIHEEYEERQKITKVIKIWAVPGF